MSTTNCKQQHHIHVVGNFSRSIVYLLTRMFGELTLRCYLWLTLVMLLLFQSNSYAQSYEKLDQLKGYRTAVYYSVGTEAKAKRMAKQLDQVMTFYDQVFQFTPSVTLLVLSPADWSSYTKFPFYGMPHYTSAKTLIVASEDNDHWKSLVPDRDKIPKTYVKGVSDTYSDHKGGLTMEPFFDLLAIHELGHAYTNQGGLLMQRRWMGELFPNIFLHTYIAEKEPQLLAALTIFPKMVVATTDRAKLKYTTLQELETNYNIIGPQYPENYGWYQCRWHIAAGAIYDATKTLGIKNLWTMFKSQKEVLNDADLAELLKTKVDKSVARVLLNWDKIN